MVDNINADANGPPCDGATNIHAIVATHNSIITPANASDMFLKINPKSIIDTKRLSHIKFTIPKESLYTTGYKYQWWGK